MGMHSSTIAVLMAPEMLPSCFSLAEDLDLPVQASPARPKGPLHRLREMHGLLSRVSAARSARNRQRSAAAW